MTWATGFDARALDGCTVDAVDVHAFEGSHRRPGRPGTGDGTLEAGFHTMVLVRVRAACGQDRPRLHLRGRVRGCLLAHSVLTPVIKGGPVALPPAVGSGWGLRMRNGWPSRRRGHGPVRRRRGRRGPSRRDCSAPRSTSPAHHDRVPVYGSGGFTNYSPGPFHRPAHRMGRAGHPARETEDLAGPGGRRAAPDGRTPGGGRRDGTVHRRQRGAPAARRCCTGRTGSTTSGTCAGSRSP